MFGHFTVIIGPLTDDPLEPEPGVMYMRVTCDKCSFEWAAVKLEFGAFKSSNAMTLQLARMTDHLEEHRRGAR